PARVLQSPEGVAEQPALVAAGGRLHAVWSGGPSGPIYHSWAYVGDAHAPDGWSEPLPLPMAGATGASPDVLVDASEALHVVYAVPLNEDRGMYTVRSDDRGESWSEAQVIFDAAAAGWAMADHPTLAVDPAGTLHVAWVRGSQDGHFPPEGIFYARSTDGGRTWSEPRAMAEGAYDWPRVAVALTGQAHLLWNEASPGGGCLHRWSADHGGSWSRQQEVPGFRGVVGPLGLTADGARTLHLVGLGRDDADEPALLYTVWDGSAVSGATLTTAEGRWGKRETFRLDLAEGFVPGAAVAVAGAQGRLSVAFRAEVKSDEDIREVVFHAERSVPAVEAEPERVGTPVPAVTPTPSPMPTPTPTPRPAVPAQPPQPGPAVLALGPLTLPMTALGGLALATLIVVGVLIGRGLGAERP
ncbi:MAG: sialidase family protein, partial [Chloroflexota bacterium]